MEATLSTVNSHTITSASGKVELSFKCTVVGSHELLQLAYSRIGNDYVSIKYLVLSETIDDVSNGDLDIGDVIDLSRVLVKTRFSSSFLHHVLSAGVVYAVTEYGLYSIRNGIPSLVDTFVYSSSYRDFFMDVTKLSYGIPCNVNVQFRRLQHIFGSGSLEDVTVAFSPRVRSRALKHRVVVYALKSQVDAYKSMFVCDVAPDGNGLYVVEIRGIRPYGILTDAVAALNKYWLNNAKPLSAHELVFTMGKRLSLLLSDK